MQAPRSQSFSVSFFALFLLTLIVILRLPHFATEFFSMDETEYALGGVFIFTGGLPYRDFVIHHPPLIYFLYAASFFIAPLWSLTGVKFFYVLLIFASALGLGRVGQRLYPNMNPRRIFSAAAFGLVLAYHSFGAKDFYAANCELLVNFLLILAVLTATGVAQEGRHRGWRSFGCGLFIALALLVKLQALFFLPAVFFLFAWDRMERSSVRAFVLGFVSVFFFFFTYLISHGIFEDYVHEVWRHGLAYALSGNPVTGVARTLETYLYLLVKTILRFCLVGLCLLPFVVAAFQSTRMQPKTRDPSRLTAAWLGLMAFSCGVGGRMFWHYFLLLIPPLVLMGLPWISRQGRVMMTGLLFWSLGVVGLFHFNAWIKPGYAAQEDVQMLAPFVRGRSEPGDRILIWGFSPQTYWATQRLPAIRYLNSDPLSGLTRKTLGQRAVGEGFWKRVLLDFTPSFSEVQALEPERRLSPCPCISAKVATDLRRHPPTWIIDASKIPGRGYESFPLDAEPVLQHWLSQGFWKPGEQVKLNTFLLYAAHPKLPK